MSDSYVTVVDIEVDNAGAPSLAERLLHWLIATGIVVAETSDCTLGPYGRAPGPRHPEALADPEQDVLGMLVNGVEIKIGHRLYDPGEALLNEVTCPRCDAVVLLRDEDGYGEHNDQFDAIEAASAPNSPGTPCPSCGAVVAFHDWRWTGDGNLAAGSLAITFWNWFGLNPAFVKELEHVFGHRLVVIDGHI
jgi:ribosomal protein S27AE